MVVLGLLYYAYVKISYIYNNYEEIVIINIEKEKFTSGAEELTGISIFKIGDTPKEIIEKGKQSKIDIFTYDWNYPKPSEIAPELSKAYENDFKINKEIRIDRVWLYFYKNKLYRIKMANWSSDSPICYNKMPLLRDAFIEKYGKGNANSKKTWITWNSGNGVRAEYIDGEDFQGKRRSLVVETANVNLLREIMQYEATCENEAERMKIKEAKTGI